MRLGRGPRNMTGVSTEPLHPGYMGPKYRVAVNDAMARSGNLSVSGSDAWNRSYMRSVEEAGLKLVPCAYGHSYTGAAAPLRSPLPAGMINGDSHVPYHKWPWPKNSILVWAADDKDYSRG